MNLFSYDEIVCMDQNEDLALHVECVDGVEPTTPKEILEDIDNGVYTKEFFDKCCYCCLWADHELEEAEKEYNKSY